MEISGFYEDVFKALKCCASNKYFCGDCPFKSNGNMCDELHSLAVDFINELISEIDRLKFLCEFYERTMTFKPSLSNSDDLPF